MDTRVKVLEAIDHDKILTDAKAYTDELANGQVKTNKEAIEAINNTETGILAKAIAADATLKTELQKEIDDDVKALADNVYTKDETFTKDEVNALFTWGEF